MDLEIILLFTANIKNSSIVETELVADGKIITGRGAGAAGEFGLKTVEVLRGAELCEKLRKAMQY